MSKLQGYSAQEQEQIKALMCHFVEGRVENGEIAETDESIKAAMPQALADAKAVFNAATEYVFG